MVVYPHVTILRPPHIVAKGHGGDQGKKGNRGEHQSPRYITAQQRCTRSLALAAATPDIPAGGSQAQRGKEVEDRLRGDGPQIGRFDAGSKSRGKTGREPEKGERMSRPPPTPEGQ